MSTVARLAQIGAVIGDPARAAILSLLLDGVEHSATELALAANVTASTASWHLRSLSDAELVAVEQRGRMRFYRLASPLAARTLEGMMTLAAAAPERPRARSRIDEALREARTCYDHFAGRLGVGIFDALVGRDLLLTGEADTAELTGEGRDLFGALGVDLDQVRSGRRRACRTCLDWSERRPHLAGAVGAALASRCFDLGWVRRMPSTRAVAVTVEGRRGLEASLGLRLQTSA
jgi:DNA-binding transcriptional ArsR family regulator